MTELNDELAYLNANKSNDALANTLDPPYLFAKKTHIRPPIGDFGVARYMFDAKTGQYRDLHNGHFISPRDLPWPDNAGFITSTRQIVKPGTILDRLGKDTGRFLGQPGASISARGMAKGAEAMEYTQYRVLKEIEMRVGAAAPVSDFGAKGGTTQYLSPRSIRQLVDDGYLEVVK